MRRILYLYANLLAGFFDVSVGMLIAAVIETKFGISIAWRHLLIGGILAVLPDFDIVLPILFHTVQGDHHQTIFHRPIVLLPVSILIGYAFGGFLWALITGVCVLFHYIHDTVGGIAWLWPFSGKYVTFRGLENPSPEINHDTWIWENWLQPSLLSISEIALGSVALLFSFLIINQYLLGVMLFILLWLSVSIVWKLSKDGLVSIAAER